MFERQGGHGAQAAKLLVEDGQTFKSYPVGNLHDGLIRDEQQGLCPVDSLTVQPIRRREVQTSSEQLTELLHWYA